MLDSAAAVIAACDCLHVASPPAHHFAHARAAGAVGTPRELSIALAYAASPRSWQRDAVSWLDKPQQGGVTREVLSHVLFLTRRQLGAMTLEDARATFAAPGRSETAIAARIAAGGVPVTVSGGVGTTLADDHKAWVLEGPAGAIRLRDWSYAERHGADGVWSPAPDALPNERMRPMVLKRQLDGVAAMTRGQAHHLATLREALEVQEMVEAILARAA